MVLPDENKKSEYAYSACIQCIQWILHIQISLSTKFHFKQFWILRLNFSKKGISGPKQIEFTFEFCIFELV